MQIHTIVSFPFNENTYVIWQPGRDDVLVIDPGLDPNLVLDLLLEHHLRPAAILNTHGHADHIAGNGPLKKAFPGTPLIIGTNETQLLSDPKANLSSLFGFDIISPPADRTVSEGDVVEEAGIRLEVLDLPGHSPGHVVFLVRDQPGILFSGDVLFQGSVGRTDFPGGSLQLMSAGIRTKLYTLPADTIVYPGHGPATTIGEEMKSNPFVGK